MRLTKLCCILAGAIVASSSLAFGLDWQTVICNFDGSQQQRRAGPSSAGDVITVDLATATQSVIGTTLGTTPLMVAITPDGTRAVVTKSWNYHFLGSVVDIVDLTTGYLVHSIQFPSSEPQGVAIKNTADGVKAYICDSNNKRLIVVDLMTYQVSYINLITSGHIYPCYIALSPTKPEAYITQAYNDGYDSGVYVVDLNSGATTLMATLPGVLSWGIAVTPDGSLAYVASGNYPYSEGYISSINLDTHTATTVVDLPGYFFFGLAITPDGQQVYAGDILQASLIAINIRSGGYRIIPVGVAGTDLLASVAITPDGKDVYLTNSDLHNAQPAIPILYRYSRETGLVSSEIITQNGAQLFSLAITPDQAPTARFTFTILGLSVQFDASSSTTPTGSIASYRWDFGDGQVETVQSPIVTHAYSSAGPKVVTLTVTNTAGTSTGVTFTGANGQQQWWPFSRYPTECGYSCRHGASSLLWDAKDPSSEPSSPHQHEMG